MMNVLDRYRTEYTHQLFFFGDLLRRHRRASQISQEALAERAGVSASAVGALERGSRRAPYRETVALLASALCLSDAERGDLEAAAAHARARLAQSRPPRLIAIEPR
jgi:transcriptional regulator with XRE-family HTH domain